MCYDAKALLETQLKRAKKYDDKDWIKEIEDSLIPFEAYDLFHASGFDHPKMLVYTDHQPYYPVVATWGLIPHWVKDDKQRLQYWNKTLNARGESIFDKPSFREAANDHRCLIYIDGFYEHHHYKGKTYPYFIHRKDGQPLILGGLWSEWVNPSTREAWNSFAIVTTQANDLMKDIHNNPKLAEARMPLIFEESMADAWLSPIKDDADKQSIQNLILPFANEELVAHTVGKLRGKEAVGNQPTASNQLNYFELINKNQTLF